MTPEEIRSRLEGAEIHIVPYAHCDWAWTHTRAWHERRYVLIFEEVLQILRAYPEFRWYLDSWVTELRPLLDRRPDLVPELHARIREGEIAVCGAFANVRPNMVGEETFLRNLAHGRRRFRELFPDVDLTVHADIVDVSVGHPQMPQVLRLAGYRYFRCWRPHEALSAKGIPYEFIWEGLDGSRILCSRGSYGGLVAANAVPEGYAQDWDAALARLWDAMEFALRHSPTRCLWLSQGGDDTRPLRAGGSDAPLDLLGLVREWNRREGVPMRFATPVEFFHALQARTGDVPIVRGTLDPCDVCYNAAWGGALGLWRLRFAADRELVAAEAWQAIAPAGPDPRPELDALWEDLFTFAAHATQWLFQEDFDELEALAQDTCRRAGAIRRRALEALARRVPQPEGCAAVVFNPLPFEREATVPLLLTAAEGIPEHVRLVDGAGRPVPFQVTNDLATGRKVWEREAVARVRVPAFGYTTVGWEAASGAAGARAGGDASEAAANSGEFTLDNGVVRLSFREGHLVAIATPGGEYPAPAGLPWSLLRAYAVDPAGILHVGEVRGWEDARWHHARAVEAGPVRWRHVAEGSVGPHPVSLETLLHAGEARVELRARVDWRGADGFLAAVWPLPFAGALAADVPFGAEAKNLDAEPYGQLAEHPWQSIERLREGMFFARSFVTLSDGERGLTHVSHDGDRYYLRGREEGTLAHILINSVRRVASGWEKDVNRQREGVGRHEFAWSLLFHPGDWRDAGIARAAAALRAPCEVLLPRGAPRADLPPQRSFLALEPAHVLLSAVYAEGDAVLLRVWETEGRPADVAARLPFAPLTAVAVDLNGEPLPEPAPSLEGGVLRFSLRPWQIATLRLAVPA